VGNKAANLILMAEAGLPVPPGFVLPTSLCRLYWQAGQRLPQCATELLHQGIRDVERVTGLNFGGNRRPLLVAVRSGAPVSMPGMLDTLLNIGLGERTLPALIRMTGNPHHAWDSYRRLIRTYAELVHGLSADTFERRLAEVLGTEGAAIVAELDVAGLKALARAFLDHFEAKTGVPFPQDSLVQVKGAAKAVFRSSNGPRAVEYRRLHRLDDIASTAVTVQAMAFGNMGATSGAGVGFTRDPATGEDDLYLDFLWNAQGEDVVSGRCALPGAAGLREAAPELYQQVRLASVRLEKLFRDAQDFEFTVQEGRLYLLQSRAARRTAWAALRIACDQVAEGLIDERTALERLAGYDLASIRTSRLVAPEGCLPIGAGVPAGPGVAVGEAVFTADAAMAVSGAGRSPILIRTDIATDDIAGLAAAAGVLTTRGGRTSHAADVARQLNKVCIVGCGDLAVSEGGGSCRIGGEVISEGAPLSLDGHSGRVYSGRLEHVGEKPTRYLEEVSRWKARRGAAGQ
jgi:pyruvate,orthophosphate dikinase